MAHLQFCIFYSALYRKRLATPVLDSNLIQIWNCHKPTNYRPTFIEETIIGNLIDLDVGVNIF